MEWDSPSKPRYHLNRSETTDLMALSSALHGCSIFRNSINKYIRFSREICVRLVRLVCAMPGGPKARAEALMHKHTSRSRTRTKQTAARASCTKRALGPAAAHVPPFMPGDQKGCGLPVAQLAGVPKARAAHQSTPTGIARLQVRASLREEFLHPHHAHGRHPPHQAPATTAIPHCTMLMIMELFIHTQCP